MSRFLEKQHYHLIAVIILLLTFQRLAALPGALNGAYLGLTAAQWYWAAIWIAIAHQVYVMLVWRAELHYGAPSRLLGDRALSVFGIGFALFSFARIGAPVGLAIATAGSLAWPRPLTITLALISLLLTTALMLSVARYFGFRRALGGDHFNPAYRTMPKASGGLYDYVDNGMYIFGFFVFWFIAFAWSSLGALLVALFNHLYIWVHYYTTEKPDMARIYKS
ncbi:MAG: methyltransferase [Chloroflexi bacterium]|nr:methyltransferase [Chloroflexota bacterium]